MGLVRACAEADVGDGDMMSVEVAGAGTLAIYRVDGVFFATADNCTHARASLADEGFLEGHQINCTWHDGAFDIRTGEPLALPCTVALKTYPVQVRDGGVFVEV